MPKKAACPRLTRPVVPTSSSRLSAKIASTTMRVTRSCTYSPAHAGTVATAASTTSGASHSQRADRVTAAAGTAGGAAVALAAGAWAVSIRRPPPRSCRAPGQPFGPPHQDDRHQQVDADAAELGEEHLAEGIDES